MLCAQAKTSSELFCGGSIDDGVTDTIAESLARRTENIVLVGMPGCGKSTVAALLSRELGRETAEADEEIAREAGMSIPEIFSRCGEERFRELETAVLKRLGKLSGRIISTGGGCVTREENYPALHQNGVIVWLQRPVDELPREGRPLSLSSDMGELYKTRAPLYGRFADICVSCAGMPEQAAAEIISRLALRQEGKDD